MSERPNIRTSYDDHRDYCSFSGSGHFQTWAKPGDVRRCQHGKVQLAYEVRGSVPAYWRDLDPLFDLFAYRKAIKALDGLP